MKRSVGATGQLVRGFVAVFLSAVVAASCSSSTERSCGRSSLCDGSVAPYVCDGGACVESPPAQGHCHDDAGRPVACRASMTDAAPGDASRPGRASEAGVDGSASRRDDLDAAHDGSVSVRDGSLSDGALDGARDGATGFQPCNDGSGAVDCCPGGAVSGQPCSDGQPTCFTRCASIDVVRSKMSCTAGRWSVDDPLSPCTSGAAARGALTITFTPQASCTAYGPLSVPADDRAGVPTELVGCDGSQGCRPDRYFAMDGDRGTSVSCQVVPSGDNFGVTLSLSVDSTASANGGTLQFRAVGEVTATGGSLFVSEYDSVSNANLSDNNCTITIAPESGSVATGSIWAAFHCDRLYDPNSAAEGSCPAEGAFLFENCGT